MPRKKAEHPPGFNLDVANETPSDYLTASPETSGYSTECKTSGYRVVRYDW